MHLVTGSLYEAWEADLSDFNSSFCSILYALHYFFFKFDFMKFVWLFYHTMTKVQPIQGRHNTTYKTIADLAKKKNPKNPVLSLHQQDYL